MDLSGAALSLLCPCFVWQHLISCWAAIQMIQPTHMTSSVATKVLLGPKLPYTNPPNRPPRPLPSPPYKPCTEAWGLGKVFLHEENMKASLRREYFVPVAFNCFQRRPQAWCKITVYFSQFERICWSYSGSYTWPEKIWGDQHLQCLTNPLHSLQIQDSRYLSWREPTYRINALSGGFKPCRCWATTLHSASCPRTSKSDGIQGFHRKHLKMSHPLLPCPH